jgi:GntR family transcriptional regulator
VTVLGAILTSERLLPDNPTPLYLRVQSLIREAIGAGQLAAGDALPAERELAAELGVSRVTVRKAIAGLVESGLLLQRRGSGTYIAPTRPRVEQPLSRLTSFTEDMLSRGMVPTVRSLDKSISFPSPEEAMVFGSKLGDRVVRLKRLRLADGVPMAIELAVVPQIFLPDPDLVDLSLYAAFEKLGLRPVRALQRLAAANLMDTEAVLLGVPLNTAALRIERIAYLADGRAIEFTKSFYRGDAYDFVAELSLGDVS